MDVITHLKHPNNLYTSNKISQGMPFLRKKLILKQNTYKNAIKAIKRKQRLRKVYSVFYIAYKFCKTY